MIKMGLKDYPDVTLANGQVVNLGLIGPTDALRCILIELMEIRKRLAPKPQEKVLIEEWTGLA